MCKFQNTKGNVKEERKDTRRNICFVSWHISFKSCTVRLSWWLEAPIKSCVRWTRGQPELLATNHVCLFKALISHSVMFFLEHGYFSGTVISAIPHQVPFWALSPDRSSAMLIKCLTDGLNSSICYNRCPLWWEEINHHTWWTEAQCNQFAATQPQMWSGLLTNYTRVDLLIPKPNWLLV